MTLRYKNMETVLKSDKCPSCSNSKPKNKPFCQNCQDKLPRDVVHDLYQPHNFTQAAAFADACTFLMNDWR